MDKQKTKINSPKQADKNKSKSGENSREFNTAEKRIFDIGDKNIELLEKAIDVAMTSECMCWQTLAAVNSSKAGSMNMYWRVKKVLEQTLAKISDVDPRDQAKKIKAEEQGKKTKDPSSIFEPLIQINELK